MLNFHYFHRYTGLDIQGLKDITSELESYGYESLLLPFNSKTSDYLIKIAHILSPNQKLKYMIALRPYVISPTYCGMMLEAIEGISRNKLMLNIVSGEILNNEEDPDPSYEVEEDVTTREGRLLYIPKFIDQLMSLKFLSSKPKIIVGTRNQSIINHIRKYTDISLCMYDDLKHVDISSFPKRMVSVQVLIRDTEEEAEQAVDSLISGRQKDYTIFGTTESIYKKFIEMKNQNITDVLISHVYGDSNINQIHELVFNIKKS